MLRVAPRWQACVRWSPRFALLAAAACSSPPAPEAPETPETPEASAPSAPASEISEGEAAIGAGDFSRAREIFERVAREQPNNARAHFYLGVALQNLGQNQEAVGSYRKAVELAPKLVEGWVNLTAAMLDAGDAAGALPVIEDALARHPGDAALLYNRALALGAQGKHAESVAAYRAALDADPSNLEVKYAYAEALAAQGSKDEAVKVLEQLSRSDKLEVLASAGRLLGHLQRFDACITALGRALAMKESPELFVSRGLCHHGNRDDVAAFEDYQRAAQADPSYAPAHYYAGMHLKMQGKKAEARAALTKARDLAAGEGVGKAAQRALEGL